MLVLARIKIRPVAQVAHLIRRRCRALAKSKSASGSFLRMAVRAESGSERAALIYGLRGPVLLAHVNLTGLHHKFHIFERANILHRVGAHGDNIRILSGLDRAKFV